MLHIICVVTIICRGHVRLGDVDNGLDLHQVFFVVCLHAENDESSVMYLHLLAILEVVMENRIQIHSHVRFLDARDAKLKLHPLNPFAVLTVAFINVANGEELPLLFHRSNFGRGSRVLDDGRW